MKGCFNLPFIFNRPVPASQLADSNRFFSLHSWSGGSELFAMSDGNGISITVPGADAPRPSPSFQLPDDAGLGAGCKLNRQPTGRPGQRKKEAQAGDKNSLFKGASSLSLGKPQEN